MNTAPDWLCGIIRKRPETVLLLHAIVLAGLRNGRVTAEDAHHISVSHPNCRGAAMKLLGKFGFVKTEPIRGTTDVSHGHWLMVWELRDRSKAEALVRHLARSVQSMEPSGQMDLAF